MKTWLVPLAALLTLTALGAARLATTSARAPASDGPSLAATPLDGLSAVLYKSPSCGCCGGYADALTAAGVKVATVSSDAEVQNAKRKHRIPSSTYSCHTITIDGYVVEGHVPLEALAQFVTERPDIDGLALPGMPSGTPGMPGPRTGPIDVLQLDGGELAPYLTL